MSLILPSLVPSQPQLTGPNSGKFPRGVPECSLCYWYSSYTKPQNISLAVPEEGCPATEDVSRSLRSQAAQSPRCRAVLAALIHLVCPASQQTTLLLPTLNYPSEPSGFPSVLLGLSLLRGRERRWEVDA